ncbi:uncharacterized protein LOC132199110 isoform X2 [Neocloeon triangulifer]|nr:uncharacterized protein LOC132199110 isoform X2 [Neocloeon triangulifer]XP_059479574.1 uncharacterized protein LOC132199110 isoform X2 [Neocloeon triangulifer]XP_059479575.1 uncharacterized protein LOC132199110 isoform X2 [Neocloeon triangulifer]
MLMVEAKLQAQPISTADAANGANLLSSLLNRKTRVEPTRDYKSVFEFLTYFLDLYRKRKLSSIADQQLLMKHLAQASTDLNRILYPEESKRCYRCAAVKARAESSCLHGVCLCGSCVFLKDNVCRQCPWPGNSFKAINTNHNQMLLLFLNCRLEQSSGRKLRSGLHAHGGSKALGAACLYC